jgi:anti-sigma regulatory factor (Ser/Thr protein kinase)
VRVTRHWEITTVDSAKLRDVRRSFAEQLALCGKSASQVQDGTIILGELLANACEHGALPIRVDFSSSGKHWQLRVTDAGRGFTPAARPLPASAVRGRGLAIVERLGGTIHVSEGRSPSVDVLLPFGD